MHRNSYICSPIALNKDLSLKKNSNVFISGQLSGVEGYVESSAIGILSAIIVDQIMQNKEVVFPPLNSMLGSLYNYIINANPKYFSPMNANFGILLDSNKENRENAVNKALNEISLWQKMIH